MSGRCACCLGIGLVALLTAGLTCCRADGNPHGRTVGGPCRYKSYPGEAKIVSLEKRMHQGKTDTSESGGDTYRVMFTFHTDETITESYAQVEDETFQVLLTNGSHPSEAFLKKYDIEEGKTFPCRLKVITQGTCTPVLFDFPTIDVSDYSVQ